MQTEAELDEARQAYSNAMRELEQLQADVYKMKQASFKASDVLGEPAERVRRVSDVINERLDTNRSEDGRRV